MDTSPERRQRFWSLRGSPAFLLRVVLAALMLSTGVGLWYAIANRPDLQRGFPGTVHDPVYVALLAVGGLGLVSLVGLWGWRKWAVPLYGILAAASVLLDVVAKAPALHQVTVLIGAGVVLTLAFLNRERFGGRAGDRP